MYKKYLAGFSAFKGINYEVWNKIISYFPSLKIAWHSTSSDFISAGIKEKVAKELFNHTGNFDLEEYFKKISFLNIDIISILSSDYPRLLKEIPNPPFIIYVKGKLLATDENAIAIVGSRKASDYGRRVTAEIAKELSMSGITIISGLAIGLDTEAHKAALNAGGRTIAVLANGLDNIYPTSNYNLAKEIINNGAIISEQPLGMPALKQNFPARNRIISGISQGILITEAGDKSGTLHTANFALEQNRQIYAIPGPIYNSQSYGPNMLIKSGAKTVTSSKDILEDFGIEKEKIIQKPDNKDEEIIFNILNTGEKHIDEIAIISKMPSEEISRIITLMEIKEKIKHIGGMIYSLS